jgi:hypothetical protein
MKNGGAHVCHSRLLTYHYDLRMHSGIQAFGMQPAFATNGYKLATKLVSA